MAPAPQLQCIQYQHQKEDRAFFNKKGLSCIFMDQKTIKKKSFFSPRPGPPLPLPCCLFCWDPPRPRPFDITSSFTISMISSGIRRYLIVLPLMQHSGILQNLSPSCEREMRVFLYFSTTNYPSQRNSVFYIKTIANNDYEKETKLSNPENIWKLET